ncbi:hypothetical protein J7J39_03280 [bacterium]|nr:hypothetical protein [bacterium]
MIITKFKDFKEIKNFLTKKEEIGIVSCNTCARICKTGGQQGMKKVARKLKKQGYKIEESILVPACCSVKLLKKFNFKSNTLLVLACDAGVAALKYLFPNKKIVPCLKEMGNGFYTEKGKSILINPLLSSK